MGTVVACAMVMWLVMARFDLFHISTKATSCDGVAPIVSDVAAAVSVASFCLLLLSRLRTLLNRLSSLFCHLRTLLCHLQSGLQRLLTLPHLTTTDLIPVVAALPRQHVLCYVLSATPSLWICPAAQI